MSAADKSKLDTLPFKRALTNNTWIVISSSTIFNVVSGRSYKLSVVACLRQKTHLAGLNYGFHLAGGSQPVTGDVRHLAALAGILRKFRCVYYQWLSIGDFRGLSIIGTNDMCNASRMLVNSEGAFVAGGTGSITLVLAFMQNAPTSADTSFLNGWLSVDEVG